MVAPPFESLRPPLPTWSSDRSHMPTCLTACPSGLPLSPASASCLSFLCLQSPPMNTVLQPSRLSFFFHFLKGSQALPRSHLLLLGTLGAPCCGKCGWPPAPLPPLARRLPFPLPLHDFLIIALVTSGATPICLPFVPRAISALWGQGPYLPPSLLDLERTQNKCHHTKWSVMFASTFKGLWQSRLKGEVSNKMKPLLLGLRSHGWNTWDCVCCGSEKPEGTLCIPADQDPRSVFVHKGLIILDLGSD